MRTDDGGASGILTVLDDTEYDALSAVERLSILGFIYPASRYRRFTTLPALHTTMSPTVASAGSNFVNSIVAIFSSLVHSVLAVFEAIFALGKGIISAVIQIVQEVDSLGVQVCGGAIHFVTGEWASAPQPSAIHGC